MAWFAICATYIRFRKAYLIQRVKVVEEAKSPLQPFLAWWGLCWTSFLCTSFYLSRETDHGALFQGYLVLTRHNQYWSIVSKSWGFTLGPPVYLSGFFFLVLFWYTRTRIVQGYWTWQSRALNRIDLVSGVAAEPIRRPPHPKLWRRALLRFLEAL